MTTNLRMPDLSTELALPPGDQQFSAGYHAPFIMHALSLDRKRTTAIEVGAHVGIVTRWLVLNYPAVYAFEPNGPNRECFERNIQNTNVFLYPYAVADRAGTGYSLPSPNPKNTGGATVRWDPPGEPVRIMTVDELGVSECSLIKIDVQGIAALDVLKGAEHTMRKHLPVVWCEGKAGGPEEAFLTDTLGGTLFVRSRDDMIVLLAGDRRFGFRSVAVTRSP